jgi:regulator of protease activity HflC (stomatin/prohibitin superfamily)
VEWAWAVLLVLVIAGLAAMAYFRPTQTTVYEFERGLRYRKGKFTGQVGPGRYWHSGRSGRITRIDVRPATLTLPGQELLTSDGITVKVSLLATIEINDPATAVNKVQNYMQAIYAALQVALREEVAGMTIESLLADRSTLGKKLLERSVAAVADIGVTLKTADVRDVMLQGDLKRVFAQEVAARKEGVAALEKARGETAALRNLANAARMIEDNPALYQLRLLQQLGATGGNTVVLGNVDGVVGRPRPRPGQADRPQEQSEQPAE